MQKIPGLAIFFLGLLFAGTLVNPVPAVRAAPSGRGSTPLVLVVSPRLNTHDMSMAEVRRVFGGDPTYVGSKRLVPFNYAVGNPLRGAFDQVALGLSPESVARYWVDRRVRGQPPPPRTVPNPFFMIAVAEKLVGGIGYVPVSAIAASRAKVVTLRIDGKASDEPGYPLMVDLSRGSR